MFRGFQIYQTGDINVASLISHKISFHDEYKHPLTYETHSVEQYCLHYMGYTTRILQKFEKEKI